MPNIRYLNIPYIIYSLLKIFSEYTNRYVPHQPEVYSSSKARRIGIPRIYTPAIEPTNSFNKNLNYRSISDCTRQPPTTPDVIETDYLYSPRRNTNIPRAYFYLGAIPNEINRRMRKKLPNLTESTNIIPSLTLSMDQFPSQEQTLSVD